MKTKSCIYLQKAVYFAPSEIRACCQRFFYKDQLKGDAVLLKAKNKNVSYSEILDAKRELINLINSNEENQCTGCPHIKKSDWPPVEFESVNVCSIEDHSLCNMRCSYCSDTFYGGEAPQYNLKNILDEMRPDENLHIAWGGGEPTLRKDFEDLFLDVTYKLNPKTQRVFTNALIYSPSMQRVIDAGLTSITTSLDAGTEETFIKVRGAKKINRVFANLSRYSQLRPDLCTIKYIFTDDNCSIHEIESFVGKVEENRLQACNFLISTDFKLQSLHENKVKGISWLYFLLVSKGIVSITFDDHIFARLRSIMPRLRAILQDFISCKSESGLGSLKELIDNYAGVENELPIYVWGTGEFAKFLLSSSEMLSNKRIKILGFVDGNSNLWGEEFDGFKILDPKILLNSNAKILIASANHYGEIVNSVLKMGIGRERIIPNFIL
ncbi:radical SAM protein [Polynucleobacter necessarius]|uniref:radical SAM protein n=1 Tax=Polynucleobacter necessarius TaxID=576610 RepID=UPI000E09BC5C|nr:radical SAM protein [Polynucleobacter necessarius]